MMRCTAILGSKTEISGAVIGTAAQSAARCQLRQWVATWINVK